MSFKAIMLIFLAAVTGFGLSFLGLFFISFSYAVLKHGGLW